MNTEQIILLSLGWGMFALTLLILLWREFMNNKMISSLIDRLQTRNLWEYKKTIETAGKKQLRKHVYQSDADMAARERKRKELANAS